MRIKNIKKILKTFIKVNVAEQFSKLGIYKISVAYAIEFATVMLSIIELLKILSSFDFRTLNHYL